MTTPSHDSRMGLALALVAAPVLWLAAEAFSPRITSDTGDQLTEIAAHPDRWYAYSALLLVGLVLFVPALAGISRVTRASTPRLTAAAVGLLGYGCVIAVADVMYQLVMWKAATAPDRDAMVDLITRVDESPGVGLFYGTGGLAFMVGSVVVTLALWRSRAVPTWAAVSLGLGLVLQLVGFMASSVPVIAVSAVLALVGTTPVARLLVPKAVAVPA